MHLSTSKEAGLLRKADGTGDRKYETSLGFELNGHMSSVNGVAARAGSWELEKKEKKHYRGRKERKLDSRKLTPRSISMEEVKLRRAPSQVGETALDIS